ncbi:50S ribosomal protein L25 [Patescibacteria group bacterium]|nr:50S ribosomal protein L25 [Patescibacteria group bacterium]MBU1472853.1 50S ribosomal protein L25 [Patescibacteria group bacterium]MBU2459510.1 50S ribosomal protein L25 [Patescibacteria group bacterium]MBU2543959.1 50S ribosomal protein L25 [Patescibacteria group bacterium]
MKKHTLQAEKRSVFGRKVKNLRRSGTIPATVYGKKIKSEALQLDGKAFQKTYEEAGETGIVELKIGETMRPVLIHDVQKDPVSDDVLHIEFFQVDLKEKVHANVPLVLVGEAPAVSQKIGTLLAVLNEIEVEALPADLPDHIDVDVSSLSEVGQELKVSDLKPAGGVTALNDAGLTVVKVEPLVSKEAAEQTAAEAAAQAATAEAQAPQAEGEPQKEGEKVQTGQPKDEKPSGEQSARQKPSEDHK